jgi:predicted outer membrane repeat protein
MVRGGLGRRTVCAGFACGLLAVLAIVIPTTASAVVGPCSPPPGTDTLQADLANADCNPIILSSGTYTASASTFTVNRAVQIVGSGASQTILTRSGTGDVLALTGGPAQISGLSLNLSTNGSGLNIGANGEGSLSSAVISSNNSTASGAGILSTSTKTVTVSASLISGNDSAGASTQGGAVANSGIGTLTFVRDLIAGNTAGGSGGAFSAAATGGTTNFRNVTFTNNHANVGGGAIHVDSTGSTTNLNNVTIAGNFADDDNNGSGDGGGIENVATATLAIGNSIVANNTDRGGQANDCKSSVTMPVTRKGYELIRDQSMCIFGGIGDTTNGFLLAGTNPLLGPLADNGGPTQTMELLQGSPAIARGDPGSTCEGDDQRSQLRDVPCDLGALEVQRAVCSSMFKIISPGQVTPVQLSCAGRDPFQYDIFASPANGSLSGFNATTGTVTYTPNAGFSGLDSFTYRAINGPPSDPDAVSSSNASVTFQVTAPPAQTFPTTTTGSSFNLKAAIKRCKKKYAKGTPKRKQCVKNAKARAKEVNS